MSRSSVLTPFLSCAAIVFVSISLGAAPAAAQDEADPLAELAALGEEMSEGGPEGGGSIRAKRDVDPAIRARKGDKRNIQAKVQSIKMGAFPAVAIKLKITKSAKDGAGKDIKRNSTIVVMPTLKIIKGHVNMKDAETLLNAGAFYLQAGDKVVVRLGKNTKGTLWQADYIERK